MDMIRRRVNRSLNDKENDQNIKAPNKLQDSKQANLKQLNNGNSKKDKSMKEDSRPRLVLRRSGASKANPAPVQQHLKHQIIPYPEVKGIERELNCIEFTDDVLKYLRAHEQIFSIEEMFLVEKTVTGKMRSVLVDWMIQVHDRFHLLPETLYLAVYITDTFLSREFIDKTELQLMGITSLFIACKYEEMYTPDIRDFEFITDGAFNKTQFFKMEIRILRTVGFALSRPAPVSFLRPMVKKVYAADSEQISRVHDSAKYFVEVGIQSYTTCHFRPSHLAATALHLAGEMLGKDICLQTLLSYTDMDEVEFEQLRAKLACAVCLNQANHKLKGIKTKYSGQRYGQVSLMSAEHLEWIGQQYDTIPLN